LRLIDYLSVPYRLEAATVELADGAWIKRVAYPELPGCVAEAAVVEDALAQLERRRIETIIRMVGEGRSPPVPRPPLRDCDPAWVARQVGVAGDLAALIEGDEATIVPAQHTDY
jgi:predicted RNase H-like HicB family nuclease